MKPLYVDFVFPELIRRPFRAISENGIMYKLDWSKKNEHDEEYKNPLQLPEPYNSKLEATEFCISHSYLDEIRRSVDLGIREWSRAAELGFDTCIREQCLEPATSYIKVAFMLLADSVGSQDLEHCYHRSIIESSMLYKFWANQTGSGLVYGKAGIDRLAERLKIVESAGMTTDLDHLKEFVDAMKAYERERRS